MYNYYSVMPRYYDCHYEDTCQDWDIIQLTNERVESEEVLDSSQGLPLHRRIYLGRQRSKFTANQLASILRISIKEYTDIENNVVQPTKSCLAKMKKFIDI